jgi:HK97 family phage portal protein
VQFNNAAASKIRRHLYHSQPNGCFDIFNGGRTDSGVRVSEMSSLQVGTIYSCVNILSDGVASLPWHIYSHGESEGRDSKELARNNPLYDLIRHQPNPEMNMVALLKVMMVHVVLWGNAFVEIERSKTTAQPVALWPRSPHKTRAIRLIQPMMLEGDLLTSGTMLYETNDAYRGGDMLESKDSYVQLCQRRLILAEDMIHVSGLSLDGRVGQSLTWACRQAIGLSMAAEKYAAKFFGNGARPAGVLTFPNKQDDDVIENIRRSWAEGHGGENVHKVAVLEEGVKFEKIAATPEEGQLLDTRKFQRQELAAMFGVPLFLLGEVEKSGKSNVEQTALSFLTFGLNPWIVKFEEAFTTKLFPLKGGKRPAYFVAADTRKLTYPDADSRAKLYAAGRQWGFLNGDDIRAMEDMNPITDGSGKVYWAPVIQQNAANLIPVQDLSAEAPAPEAQRSADGLLIEHSARTKGTIRTK